MDAKAQRRTEGQQREAADPADDGAARAKPLGRRGERFRQAVLDCTIELVVTNGIESATVAAVAAAAGVHESSIYRNFGTWENLVREAVNQRTDAAVPTPDTGGITGDLRQYAASMIAFLSDPAGEALLRLGPRPHAPSTEYPAQRERFWQELLDRACVMVTRAIERGELRADCDPRLLIEALIGVLFAKVLFFQEPLHDGLLDELVEQLLRGVRSPG